MIPFPGESISIFDASEGGAYSPTLDVALRYRGGYYPDSPGSATLAAGDVWRLWTLSSSLTYIEPGSEADVVVSWVVEVLSGTVTLSAGETLDPDYASDYGLAAAMDLGTHTVTGPATLVIPSGFTGAQVANFAGDDISFMLRLEALAGSAEVQQVKMRVWPTGGVVGGWSDPHDSFTTDPVNAEQLAVGVPIIGASSAVTGAEASWDAMIDDLHANTISGGAAATRTLGPVSGPIPAAQQGMFYDGDGKWSASTQTTSVLYLFIGRDWTTEYPIGSGLVEGVDWIRPPAEVDGDRAALVQQTGAGATGWENASIYLVSSGDLPGGFAVSAQAGDWPDEDTGTSGRQVTAGVSVGAASVGQNALPTTGRMILASVAHTVLAGDADVWPGWAPGLLDPDSRADVATIYRGVYPDQPIQTYAFMPAYRVWDPTATPVVVSKVRQLHRDDGLGVTPRRHFGGASRRNTGRHFGYD